MSIASRKRWNEKRSEKRRLAREGRTDLVVKPDLPIGEFTAEEIICFMKERYKRKVDYEEARKLIKVVVPISGPIGIVHFGDPHVDDDGTDWAALERDIKLVRETEGLFASNIGDTTNNWVGRLGRLYGQQATSAKIGRAHV